MLAILALGAGACEGSDSKPKVQGTTEPTTTQPTTSIVIEVGRSCMPVPHAVVKAIESGLTVQGGGKLRGAYAVKSRDFSSVYFISAEIQGPGLENNGDIGTWATNRLEVGGLIYTVDSVAQEFSDWGHGDKTDAQLSMDDDGAEDSAKCVG